MSVPALSRNYWARANAPFASTATQLAKSQSQVFLFKTMLTDQATGGTSSGTRSAASKWTVVNSVDGSGTAPAGTDTWIAATNLVWAASGTNHSWCVLRNAALGYDCLIDCNIVMPTPGLKITFAPTASGYSGGTASVGPLSSGNEVMFGVNQNTVSTNSSSSILGDNTTLGLADLAHFSVADTGEFIFSVSRVGGSTFQTFWAFQHPIGGEAGDTRNYVAMAASQASGGAGTRPVPSVSNVMTASFASQRCTDGSAMSAGGFGGFIFGNSAYPSTPNGVSTQSANYLVDPIRNRVINSQASGLACVTDRGTLQDIYTVGTAIVGSSYPTTGATQTHVVMGDMLVPFPIVAPSV